MKKYASRTRSPNQARAKQIPKRLDYRELACKVMKSKYFISV